MYTIMTSLLWVSITLMTLSFICLIGQLVEMSSPETPIFAASTLFCLIAAIVLAVCIGIYDKGMEAARKEQEPDEVISRTGEEGVFLQPTGSHETDPFIEEETNE